MRGSEPQVIIKVVRMRPVNGVWQPSLNILKNKVYIVAPEQFVETWLKDSDVDELNSNIERYGSLIEEKKTVIKRAYNDLKKIKNIILKTEFLKGIEKDADDIETLKSKLKIALQERDSH
jgi:hypothetical protein